MVKLKPLLPTLKEKKRYVAFEIISKANIKTFPEASKAIWQSVLSFAGTKHAATMGVHILPETYNARKQRGLIRVGHKHVDELTSSLTLVQTIEHQPVIIRTVGVSGILAKAQQKYIS